MIADSIERLAGLGVWAPPVPEFLKRTDTLDWLARIQALSSHSDDETVLLLLAAMRSVDLQVLDGQLSPDQLAQFIVDHDSLLQEVCLTHRVQANVAERALPILEFLGRERGRERLFVTELGCSFGLIGRVLVSAAPTLQGFERYFSPAQQRPDRVPLVTGYQGIDLSPPDERWLLACIPLAALRSRVARFIYEVPATEACRVIGGSALDRSLWHDVPQGITPVILTSFMLYQLPSNLRSELTSLISDTVRTRGGTWINLDVHPEGSRVRLVLEQDGHVRMTLSDDRCSAWTWV